MNIKHFIEDKLLVIELNEEIDHYETEKIRKRADYEIQRLMPQKVIFDFKKVNFMDSAGIGLIMGRFRTVSCYGGNIELINANNKIEKIFEMSGLKKFVVKEKLA